MWPTYCMYIIGALLAKWYEVLKTSINKSYSNAVLLKSSALCILQCCYIA